MTPEHYPQFIAHRGAGKLAPENTLAAFREGARHGYKMFECDTKLSQDKQLILLHDDQLQRTSNGYGSPAKLNWAQLACLDAGQWHSPHYVGEPLARLSALIDFVLANHYQLDIEIKPNPGEAYQTGQKCVELLQHYVAHHVERGHFLLSSFSPEALQAAYDLDKQIARALLVDKWHPQVYAILAQLACQGLITHYQIITPEIIEYCHARQMQVMVYTPNERRQVQQLLAMGVDTIITDNMHLLSTLTEAPS